MPWDNPEAEYPWPDKNTFTMVFGHVGDFRIDVAPMIFNDRLLVNHRSDYPYFVVAGFCYDKGGLAAIAAMAWLANWEEFDVPPGFKKIAVNDLPAYGKGLPRERE